MKKMATSLMLTALFSHSVWAVDYTVDYDVVTDLEKIRPLIEQCSDVTVLTPYRGMLSGVEDLESLRGMLERIDLGRFNGCPDGVIANGIERQSE
ncbi:hypothetical protein [Zhongshania aquimaris]|uniref:Uncharacterized protein n=1 Tax=Zhongshania aquimaris TaxID=2857107 RepID=A0ABS6VV02_9GAMM|nr:hypothetical protein [Zhongshania aquimaris]MBW2942163.1 hypothetical protein [Zhongshania aquimaris]